MVENAARGCIEGEPDAGEREGGSELRSGMFGTRAEADRKVPRGEVGGLR